VLGEFGGVAVIFDGSIMFFALFEKYLSV